MIQVLIPTRCRPHLLRVALNSVRLQSAIDQVRVVVVSENGECEESRAACNAFPDLPIKYIYRSPQLTSIDHHLGLLAETSQPFTALLHDDDWWHPAHLETAMLGLRQFPKCRSYYSNYFSVSAGNLPGPSPGITRVWVASGCDFEDKPLIHLSFRQALVANLLTTSFHYSTLVAHTDSFAAAIRTALAAGNDFDNDRMVPMCLAEPEGLAYSTVALVAVRNHATQDQRSQRFNKRWHIMAETTRWLKSNWPVECTEAADLFNSQSRHLNPETLRTLRNLPEPLLSTLVEEIGFKGLKTSVAERCLMFAKMWIPPVLRPACSYLRQACSAKLRPK
jgi:hypothetical protein